MICHLFPEPSFLVFSTELSELFYYSHLPTVFVALAVGLFVFASAPHQLLNRLLFVLSILFALWIGANLVVWTNIHSQVILFAWSFFWLLSGLIALTAIYLVSVFVTQRDIGPAQKLLLAVLALPLIILAPTKANLSGFDLVACDAFGFESEFFSFYPVLLGTLAVGWIFILLIRSSRNTAPARRFEISLLGAGIEIFLILFFATDFISSQLTSIGVFEDSELELYGLFGMTIFMVYIGILLVRSTTFSIGLIASQVLVPALAVLIGAQLTFVQTPTSIAFTCIALIFTLILGTILVRSIRKEVRLRQTVEAQEQELEKINAQQVNLLHFISHEIKGNLNKAQGVFAGMLEGDYGQLSAELSHIAKGSLDDVRGGIAMVMDILDASNLRKGSVSYDKKPFDIRHTVLATTDAVRNVAMARGLQVEVITPPSGALTINGDEAKLEKHVIRNLVDNAIHYTQEGFVRVSIHAVNNTVRFAVEDSGVGITPEDMAHLFTEGGKGKDSTKINVNSTGYGLFIARQVVEAHGGTIRAESEGAGKGSRFVVELPLA